MDPSKHAAEQRPDRMIPDGLNGLNLIFPAVRVIILTIASLNLGHVWFYFGLYTESIFISYQTSEVL